MIEYKDEISADDKGSLCILQSDDGTVTVTVRSARSTTESKQTMPLADWLAMIGVRMSWFWDQRQKWIAETVGIFGFINREHIMSKFGISMPQASIDLQDFQKRNPDAISYDASRKCYVRNDK